MTERYDYQHEKIRPFAEVIRMLDAPISVNTLRRPVEHSKSSGKYVKEASEVKAMQIPKDVQDGIREFYGDDELLRRTAETDQRDARLREELEEDIREIEERHRHDRL